MSFLKRLFGGGGGGGAAKQAAAVEYKGFSIRPDPFPSGNQFQTAGVIEKEIGGEPKVHRFIRADRHGTREDAENFAIEKGKQIIDEQGDRLFG